MLTTKELMDVTGFSRKCITKHALKVGAKRDKFGNWLFPNKAISYFKKLPGRGQYKRS